MMITFLGLATHASRGSRRAAQSSLTLAALALCLAATRASANGETEASFGAGRIRDDLAGVLADAAKEVRITLHATAGSKLSATLGVDKRDKANAGAAGLALVLQDADGDDLSPTARPQNVSTATLVKWKNVPLPETGDFTLIVRATAPGTWRLQLGGVVAATTATETSPALAPLAEDEISFEGLARGTASWTLARATRTSKFAGEAVRIVQPDDTDLPDVPTTASGKVTILQDGTHRLVYTNAGTAAGDAKATVRGAAPKPVRRQAYVRPAGTVLVPVVTKVSPGKAFQGDDAVQFTLTGRDFQDGADVRLVRKGRDDIVATSVVVRSETEIGCVLDLDTKSAGGPASGGVWTVGVWNAPEYTTPDDATTLVKESPTRSLSKRFQSLTAASIALPAGVVKGSEVWFLDFNDAFQTDLDRMGLGSAATDTEAAANTVVRAYTLLFLRDLMRANETTGGIKKNVSAPVSFIVSKPPSYAAKPGVDYNRIEIGGAWQSGDPQDPAEPLAWGASGVPGSEIDFGNERRDDLSILDGEGARIGLGARTRILDPGGPSVSSGFAAAMQPLRGSPLTAADRRYFALNFVPQNQTEADRYAVIVNQVTRASREIAAICAHHIGKAMGLEDGAATGPMSNPTTSGDLWPTTTALTFTDADVQTLLAEAVPHAIPGTTRTLQVTWFPLWTTHDFDLGNVVTPGSFNAAFGFVGGRPNAVKTDYTVAFGAGGILPPRQLALTYDGLAGTVPLSQDGNPANYMCYVAVFRVAVTDKVRGGSRVFRFRLDTYPNVNDPGFPAALVPGANACIANLPP